MTAITSLVNHQIRLASRPVGLPTRDNWSATTEPVTEPGTMKSKEDIVIGIENFPEALSKLFNGEDFGKLVLEVAKP